MPTHKLISNGGDVATYEDIKKYIIADNPDDLFESSKLLRLIHKMTSDQGPQSGFHIDLQKGGFSGETYIFRRRLDALLNGTLKDDDTNTILECRMNDMAKITDRSIFNHFCPMLKLSSCSKDKNKKGHNIIDKLKKCDDQDSLNNEGWETFIVKAILELALMDQDQLKHLINSWNYTIAPKEVAALFVRAFFKLDKSERDQIQDRSNWKRAFMSCGNHTNTISCSDTTKDFCKDSNLSKYFGLVVILAVFLPGLIQGLGNLLHHKVIKLF